MFSAANRPSPWMAERATKSFGKPAARAFMSEIELATKGTKPLFCSFCGYVLPSFSYNSGAIHFLDLDALLWKQLPGLFRDDLSGSRSDAQLQFPRHELCRRPSPLFGPGPAGVGMQDS